jgi:hypothetical protein
MTPNSLPAPSGGLSDDGSPLAGQRAVLELRVADLRQLFNSMDPAPFHERDLDVKAQAYIVDWAQEVSTRRPLFLMVHLDGPPAAPDDAAMLREAIDEFFRQRALSTRRQLRRLFRVGRVSLLIGLAFLATATVTGEAVASLIRTPRYVSLIQDSLIIGGWVALWRPLEIFLYDWWPIRDEARLYERLSQIDVGLHQTDTRNGVPS